MTNRLKFYIALFVLYVILFPMHCANMTGDHSWLYWCHIQSAIWLTMLCLCYLVLGPISLAMWFLDKTQVFMVVLPLSVMYFCWLQPQPSVIHVFADMTIRSAAAVCYLGWLSRSAVEGGLVSCEDLDLLR